MGVEDEELGEEQQPRRLEPEQQPQLNGKVLYDMSGSTPHGCFPIGNGAVINWETICTYSYYRN